MLETLCFANTFHLMYLSSFSFHICSLYIPSTESLLNASVSIKHDADIELKCLILLFINA